MPVAQHHHQHSPSFLSSLGNILHMRPQQSNVNANASVPASERGAQQDAFEVNLAQRLNLLLPTEGTTFLNLASLRQAFDVLLATESDLKTMLGDLKLPLSPSQNKMVSDFLERSVKLLDVCNSVGEAISEVQKWKMLLDSAVQPLSGKQADLTEAKLRRARKVLGEVRIAMEGEKEEEAVPSQQQHRSLRWSNRHLTEGGYESQRWRSWHGNTANSSNTTRQAPAMGVSLNPPKCTDVETEEGFSAAMYALNVISVFFLSVMTVALPCQSRNIAVSCTHPRQFQWVTPLLNLQDKALDETKKRGKRSGNGDLWELEHISMLVRKLFETADAALVAKAFPLSDVQQEEIKNLLKQLGHYLEELQRNLGPIDEQVREFFHRLIDTRMELLDLLGHSNA